MILSVLNIGMLGKLSLPVQPGSSEQRTKEEGTEEYQALTRVPAITLVLSGWKEGWKEGCVYICIGRMEGGCVYIYIGWKDGMERKME